MNTEFHKELERTCERATHELSQINDRIEGSTVISPQDLDNLFKLTDIIKDVKSIIKKTMEIESMDYSKDSYKDTRYTYAKHSDRDEIYSELGSMLKDARDDREAEVIKRLMHRL